MDRELAGAVFQRWQEGLPIAETTFCKAASALGVDPNAALLEARFYSVLDNYLLEKRAMTGSERVLFSVAAGFDPTIMVKTASAHGLSSDELVLEALRQQGFRPNLTKLANLSGVGGDPTVDPNAGMDPNQQQAAQVMGMPPQQGMQVQQAPIARSQPSPTAPEQIDAMPGGNMDALLQNQQQTFGQGAQDNGGMPASGMPEPPPPPPSPEERIQQVGPNLDPETVSRYAEQLQRFEEGFGMPINDPKQMVKFVKELQKLDGKKIDQGIKAMSQQIEQEQAQELGVDGTPTIDGAGGANGAPVMAPKGQLGGDAAQAGSQPPQDSQAMPDGGSPEQAGPPRAQKPLRPQPQQVANAAAEKVAHVARILARSHAIR